MHNNDIKKKKSLLLAISLGVLLLAIGAYVWHANGDFLEKTTLIIYNKIDSLAQAHPIFLITTTFLLVICGMPVSFFYILTTAVYGINQALIINSCMLALQLCITYGVAAYVFKQIIENWLRKKGYKTKQIPKNMQTNVTVLFRAVPVLPVAIQNIILAIGGVPFKKYFWLSWPLQCLWMVAIVLSSGSIFEGNLGFGMAGIMLLVMLILVTQLLKKRTNSSAKDFI